MNTLPLRKIIHCDCDCFYAAIEMRDNPRLQNLPVAVGGSPSSRGVIATCNYIARKFGVHSAMASAYALRLCPHLIIIKPRFEIYRTISKQILSIYHDFTDLVEPLSLDEAYLDVSQISLYANSATRMAQAIRQRIAKEIGITASAGVAPNKFLAKIASDWRKPDGLFVIEPAMVDAFVAALPVKKLFGVGKVTARKLEEMGVVTCADLHQLDPATLTHQFGKFGRQLSLLAQGIDERPVEPNRKSKSISVERTFAVDLPDLPATLAIFPLLFPLLHERIERKLADKKIRQLFVKLKFADFTQTTVECLSHTPDEQRFLHLGQIAYMRRQLPVRLVGIGVRLAEIPDIAASQLSLFAEE